MRTYISILIKENACRRTKNRFLRFKNKKYRIEFLNEKVNEHLTGDGFVPGELMSMFGIDTFHDGLWSRAWEGWIPNKEIEILNNEL